MRPVEFSSEEIVRAGQELQAAGRNITGFALRQKIGGGNPARLKQVWDEHLSTRAEAKAEPVSELPVEVAEEVAAVAKRLAERLNAFAVEVNNRAVKAADRRVAEVIRSTGEQHEQAERELADATQTVEELESKLDGAKEQAAGLETRVAELQTSHQAQAVELAQVRERLTLIDEERTRYAQHAEQMRTERDNARIEAANFAGQVKALQEQLNELMRTLGTSQMHGKEDAGKSGGNA